jgi:TrmH family RNA methyltransferase
MSTSKARVVLVDPEKPRNIGFVARAMKCFGVEELRIVSTTFPSMHSAAYITGTCAKDVLDNATFYDSLDDALKDADHAVAFSRRNFESTAVEFSSAELQDQMAPFENVALVFGRESQGLNGDEIAQCNSVCYIPTDDGLSFNLGQAVSIAIYEAFGRAKEVKRVVELKSKELASRDEINSLFIKMTDQAPEYFGDERKGGFLKRFIERTQPTRQEIKLLFGWVNELIDGPKSKRAKK